MGDVATCTCGHERSWHACVNLSSIRCTFCGCTEFRTLAPSPARDDAEVGLAELIDMSDEAWLAFSKGVEGEPGDKELWVVGYRTGYRAAHMAAPDELTAPPAYPDILSEIEERRTDEAFMERIRNRVAEDADLLQRIGDDELYIADLRAQLSQTEAERDALRDERDRLAEQIATSTDRTELTALRERLAELEKERDLALAHDTQPYPTADAYEKVCAARTHWHMSYKGLEDGLRDLCDEWEKCIRDPKRRRGWSGAAVLKDFRALLGDA